jgi:hypothetical protein
MTDLKKYYIRFSNATDHDKLMEFYDDNTHKNVFKRDEALIKQLVENGSVTIVEDDAGKFVAASISYPINVIDANGIERTKWIEIGTTRIVLNGYPGLFDVMTSMQVLRAFVVEPPEERMIAQMDTTPVQNMAIKMGWVPCQVPQEVLDAKTKMLSDDGSIKARPNNWFQFNVEAMPVTAQYMSQVLDNLELVNKKTGEKILVDFSRTKFIALFEKDIRDLANANLGDRNNPDLKRGMAQSRQKYLRRVIR